MEDVEEAFAPVPLLLLAESDAVFPAVALLDEGVEVDEDDDARFAFEAA